nr:MAG TPA: hypothetical protein [Caudoviricetes sp.]
MKSKNFFQNNFYPRPYRRVKKSAHISIVLRANDNF